jgi:LPS-assembly lipoprotein
MALAIVLLLAACQVRPLYSTTPATPGPQADLPAIHVAEPNDRVEQSYRNALLFALQGGGGGTNARYEMIFRMTVREQEIAVERETGTPNAYQLTGGVSFLIKEIATGTSLFGASVARYEYVVVDAASATPATASAPTPATIPTSLPIGTS